MIRYTIILGVLIILSCNHKQAHPNFEVAKVDYHKDWLQRIFVVVDSGKVYDTLFIGQVIHTLRDNYPIDKRSAISFFSEKKYADYKTELFMNDSYSLPATEYKNWSNSYLGEYDLGTNEYKTFPLSDAENKHHVYSLKWNK